jgi:SPP1 gp7 family putative phage head morphogenesis protein
MREALAFWQDKVPMRRDDFDELDQQMRARSFYVSGLSRTDQIAAVQEAIYKALDAGETIEDFKGRIPDIIAQKKWSGVRLEVIFRTNVQSAYNAGRYAQMKRPEVMNARPYWQYSAINDGRTRPAHRAMSGRVFPADHPVWDTWYPPNGYRCRCGVNTLSAREVERDGLTVETDDPTGTLYEPEDWKTGQKMPARPMMPDSGFSRNIGKEWTAGFSPTELDKKIADFPLPAWLAGGVCKAGPAGCFPPLKDMDRRHVFAVNADDLLPDGLPPEDYARAFLAEFGIDDINGHKIHMLPGNIPVAIDKGFFIDKATGGWKTTLTDKGPFVRLMARTILSPYEMFTKPVELPSGMRQTIRLIRMFSTGKTIGGYCVWNLIHGRWWSATAFMPKAGRSQASVYKYLEEQRKGGVLIYREELK